MCVGSILRTAGCISQLNKQEVQITYHSHSNCKYLKLQKTVARWMLEMLTFGLEVWCGFVKRRGRVLVETSVTIDVEAEKEQIL